MIQVTHDQREAMIMADKIMLIKDGAKIALDTPIRLYESPPNIYTAEFIGRPSINTIASEIKNHELSLLNTTLNIQDSIKDQVVMVGIRPEDIIINNNGHFSGAVIMNEKDGQDNILTLETEYGQLLVRTTYKASEGERLFMSIRKSKVHLFNIVTGVNLNYID